jgi:hypothetical protein
MGSVFVTKTRQPPSHEVDTQQPCAQIIFGGVYFFLHKAILELRERTGELIDPQTDSFFDGQALEELDRFLRESTQRVLREPNDWQQRVSKLATGDPVFECTSRASVLDLLERLNRAVALAREQQRGVFFMGE